jgi:hypothetical protein
MDRPMSTLKMVEAYYASVLWQALALFQADAAKHDLNFAFVLAALLFGIEVFRRRRTPERRRFGLMKVVRDAFVATFSVLLVYAVLNVAWHFIVIPADRAQADVQNIATLDALSTQNKQLVDQGVQDRAMIDKLNGQITNFTIGLTQSKAATAMWREQFAIVAGKLGGREFARQLVEALGIVEDDTNDANEKDIELKRYEDLWKKKLVPHPPMSSLVFSHDAREKLTADQAHLNQLNSQWERIFSGRFQQAKIGTI